MSKRRLRLCRHRHYSESVPEVRFGGKWFYKQGFHVGDYIDLILEGDQIIIRHTPDNEIPHTVAERKSRT